jgi:tetratricopeptide (TPR) repeat protein
MLSWPRFFSKTRRSSTRRSRGRLLAALLSLVVLSALAFAVSRRSETERLFSQATRAIENDDYQAATRLFREITITYSQSPEASRALYQLAEIYLLRIRDVGAAHASLVKLLDDYPESPVALSAHRLLARLYEQELGTPERAVPHYQVVLESNPDVGVERETLLALGDCLYQMDQIDDAAAAYRKALALPYDPTSDSAYVRLASLSRLMGKAEEALGLFQDLASRTSDPTRRYEAYVGEAEILLESERFGEASERLREAEKVSPGSNQIHELQARLEAAQLERQSGDDEGVAIEELQKKIRWGAGRRTPRREP